MSELPTEFKCQHANEAVYDTPVLFHVVSLQTGSVQ